MVDDILRISAITLLSHAEHGIEGPMPQWLVDCRRDIEKVSASSALKQLSQIPLQEIIRRHIDKTPMLPKNVSDMNETEFEIFKVAAFHMGFLQFLRDLSDESLDKISHSLRRE